MARRLYRRDKEIKKPALGLINAGFFSSFTQRKYTMQKKLNCEFNISWLVRDG